jgi:Bacteriophage terminase large (ATPase) subunit and inactivated derivatives
MTFTPLLGMSTVVKRFLKENSPDRHDTNMVIEDALHIPAEKRQQIIDSYPPHQREARTRGDPIMGDGLIFPVARADISVQAFAIPKFWPQIGALDFGWDHPFAAVKLAYDTEGDIVYVTHTYRERHQTPAMQVIALKPWGPWLPWAWPHDGLQHSKDSGEPLAKQYSANGLNMLGSHAQFSDGSTGVEAGLFEMLERMLTGRFKVFDHLHDWFEELSMYCRKEGKVEKIGDDLMAATRYGIMSLRHSVVDPTAFKAARQDSRQSDPLAMMR